MSGFEVKKVVQWGHAYIPLLMVRQWLLRNRTGDAAIKQGFDVSPPMNAGLSMLRHFDVLPLNWIDGASSMVLAQKR